MKLKEEDITEIAELLECGMVCFYHQPTGTIEYYPDPNDLYYDPEPWQELIEKIESDWDNYLRFEKMDSRQGYKMMEDFAYQLSDLRFRDKILETLSRRKPFQNFKNLIDYSDYRQDWFDFRRKTYIDFTKRQVGYI